MVSVRVMVKFYSLNCCWVKCSFSVDVRFVVSARFTATVMVKPVQEP